ncbi:hypothetical protein FRC01_002600, partial [Tulasnella sp. 417]
VRAAKHLARTVCIRFSANDVLKHGLEILAAHEEGEIDALPTEDKKFSVFQAILQMIPDTKRKLMGEKGDEYLEHLASRIDEGVSSARSDDTMGLKKVIVDFIGPVHPPIAKNQKCTRGFKHHVTGDLLCPPRLDWTDRTVRQQLKDEVTRPKVKEYPKFLYAENTIQEGDVFEGLFRGPLLMKAAKHIFIGPSSADSQDTSSRSTRQGNAALNGMTKVSRETIAYIATMVRFALSSDESFGADPTRCFDIYAFYRSIVNMLEMPDIQTDVKELLEFWDQTLFGQNPTEEEDDEDDTFAILRRQRVVIDFGPGTGGTSWLLAQVYKYGTSYEGGKERIGDKSKRTSALCGLGDVHRSLGEYTQAIACYSEALEIETDLGCSGGRAKLLKALAHLNRVRGQYTQAIAFFSEALTIATENGNKADRADIFWGLAEVHRSRTEYSQAITFYSEAEQICSDIGAKKGRSLALYALAEIHQARKEYTQAVKAYSEVVQIRTAIGDTEGRVQALINLAEVHKARKEYTQAVKAYSEVVQIRTDIGDAEGRVQALINLAIVQMARLECEEAIKLLLEAFKISTDVGDRTGKVKVLWCLAEMLWIGKQYSQADAFYAKAIQLDTDISNIKRGKAQALWGLATAHRLRKEYDQARACYLEILEIGAKPPPGPDEGKKTVGELEELIGWHYKTLKTMNDLDRRPPITCHPRDILFYVWWHIRSYQISVFLGFINLFMRFTERPQATLEPQLPSITDTARSDSSELCDAVSGPEEPQQPNPSIQSNYWVRESILDTEVTPYASK